MELDFVNLEDEKFNYLEEKFNYFFEKTINFLNLKGNYFVEVNIINDDKIHQINKDYRNKDSVTDVISFAFNDDVEGEIKLIDSPINDLGEIYINYQRAIIQANDLNQSFDREICFLFVHGLLHLLGYDHMKKEDEEVMFGLQRKIFEGENL